MIIPISGARIPVADELADIFDGFTGTGQAGDEGVTEAVK